MISLVMTVRDGARFLAQAIDSVRAQTLSDWELVVWDDGSTDDTPSIIASHAQRDPRIRAFRSEAIGRRRALVEAHASARGDTLAWIDADDWLHPEALALTHAVLTRTGVDLVYTDHVIVDANGTSRGPGRRTRIPYSRRRLLVDFMTFHFRLFTREVFERAGGIDADREIAIDYDLCLRISEIGQIRHLAEPLYFYREHPEQMSTRRRAAQIEASAAAIRAALSRRGRSVEELEVDLVRGRFRLVPRPPPVRRPPTGWLRVALETVFPKHRGARACAHERTAVLGSWPARRPSVYAASHHEACEARGVTVVPIGDTLVALIRAVWAGRSGDTLHVHSLATLFDTADPARAIASSRVFVKTLDHALARGLRLVWTSRGPLGIHARHRGPEEWCHRALVERCDVVVTHWPTDLERLRALGAPSERTSFVPYPDVVHAYPEISRSAARARLGVDADLTTLVFLGGPPRGNVAKSMRELVVPHRVDQQHPRAVAERLAAADLAVVAPASDLTSSALATAMAFGKPVVAPELPGVLEVTGGRAFTYSARAGMTALDEAIQRACAARASWDELSRGRRTAMRASTWDAAVAAVIGTL